MQGTTQRRIVMLHRHFDVSQSQTLLRGGSSSFDVEALQHLLEHDNHETRYCQQPGSEAVGLDATHISQQGTA